jgi:hypothetical protein
MNFSELIGQKILIQTAFGELEAHRIGGSAAIAELTGVDPGGIWIVHSGLVADLAQYSNVAEVMKEQR